MDILVRIKQLVLRGNIIFTRKAESEMSSGGIDADEVVEAILNAPAVAKRLRSKNPESGKREYLYVIVGTTFGGVPIYTKGKILKHLSKEIFYVLISSKKSEF